MNGRGLHVAHPVRRDLLGERGINQVVSNIIVQNKGRFEGIGDPINYNDASIPLCTSKAV